MEFKDYYEQRGQMTSWRRGIIFVCGKTLGFVTHTTSIFESPPANGTESMTVSDLINPYTQQWNIELIQGLFGTRDVKEILNVALHLGIDGDKCIWHHGNDGKYSVRSGYKIAQEILVEDEKPYDQRRVTKVTEIKHPAQGEDFSVAYSKEYSTE